MEIDAVPVKENGRTMIRVAKVTVQGNVIDINDRKAINSAMATCQQVMEQLRLERPHAAARQNRGRGGPENHNRCPELIKTAMRAWRMRSAGKNITRLLRIPKQFVPAVTAFFEEGYEAGEGAPAQFFATARKPQITMTEYAMYGEFKKFPGRESYNIDLKLGSKKRSAPSLITSIISRNCVSAPAPR